MIKEKQLRFQIHTRTTTYLFEVTKSGHLKHYYYGPALSEKDAANWEISNSVGWGCSLLYRQDDPSEQHPQHKEQGHDHKKGQDLEECRYTVHPQDTDLHGCIPEEGN